MRENSLAKTLSGFYFGLTKKFWPVITGFIFFATLEGVLCNLLPALTIKWLVDGIANAAPGEPLLTQLMPVLFLIIGLRLLMLFADIFSSWIKGNNFPAMKVEISRIIFCHISKQSLAFFKRNSTGFLVEQANYVINKFYRIVLEHANTVLGLIITIAINITLLFQVHWTVACSFIICAAVRLTHCSLNLRKIWESASMAARLSSVVTAKHVDSLSNFMNVKLFSKKDYEVKYLDKTRIEHKKMRQRANYYERKFWILPYSFEQVCLAAMMFLVIHLYQIGQINLGDIAFTFMSFATMMTLIRRMTWDMSEITEDITTAVQAYKDIAKPIAICDAPGARPIKLRDCGIDFCNMSFKYEDERQIFKNLNLSIKPGEKVGLVGLSGSGKSSLLYLLMRIYDIHGGAIKIDGQDIREITQESLHDSISFVPQDNTLFNRTIAENISYGKPYAGSLKIMQAAKKSSAHEFIKRTEKGYKTTVGDRGLILSGGQRQRISIARAICKDAPIIIMDEATSALDSKTEVAVQKSLTKMFKGRTAIVIAHRLSTLRQMDRIIVLSKGKIVEQGPHRALIKNKDGIYAKLWKMQVGGFIKES